MKMKKSHSSEPGMILSQKTKISSRKNLQTDFLLPRITPRERQGLIASKNDGKNKYFQDHFLCNLSSLSDVESRSCRF